MKLLLTALFLSLAWPVASMECVVSQPILRKELDAGATWYFEIFDATPSTPYSVKINYPEAPANQGRPNADLQSDETGYCRMYLPGYWSPDGALPETGPFTVEVYGQPGGKAECEGEVMP